MTALFVYGTLMQGEYYHSALIDIAGAPARICPARVRGRLRLAGSYAALEIALDTWVHGEYMLFDADPATWLARLDELEEYNPRDEDRSLYLRREIECTLSDATKVRAWTYIAGPQALDGPPIASGDWRKRNA